jgi:hypothetical protein
MSERPAPTLTQRCESELGGLCFTRNLTHLVHNLPVPAGGMYCTCNSQTCSLVRPDLRFSPSISKRQNLDRHDSPHHQRKSTTTTTPPRPPIT